jgi:ribosomal protein S18 acetylase RimI-like enzyme
MSSVEICPFNLSNVEEFRSIRLEALQREPEAFGTTYDQEVRRSIADFSERLATSTIFGAFIARDVVGMAGFRQGTGQKDRHKAFVFGVYVRPEVRRRGVGTALMEALLRSASEVVEQLTLTVVVGNDAAIALYRRFEFQIYGVEPRALKHNSQYWDELLMARVALIG